MARWMRFGRFLLGLILIGAFSMIGAAAQSGFVPITPDNAGQVRLLATLMKDNRSGVFQAFSPDGMYLASYAKVWNIRTFAEVPLSGGSPLAFSPDSTALVVTKTDSTALLSLKTGETRVLVEEASANAEFISDGKAIRLISALDRLPYDCEIVTAVCVESPNAPQQTDKMSAEEKFYAWLRDHRITSLQLDSIAGRAVFSPDNSLIALYSLRGDQPVVLIDSLTAEHVTLDTQARDAVFSPNSRLLITDGDAIQFWSLDGLESTLVASVAGGPRINISPDGSTLVSFLQDGIYLIYGIPTPERNIQPLVLPGEIGPSNVNVRAEPSGESEALGLASGNVVIGGRSEKGDYVYLPDYAGWARADSAYLRLEGGLSVDMLPVLDSPEAIAALSTPTAMPPTPTLTPTLTPGPTTTPSAASSLPIGAPVVQPPEPPAGTQRIASSNLDAVRLLGVLPLGIDYRWSQELARLQNNRLMVIDHNYRGGVNTVQFWDLFKMTGYSALEIRSPQDLSASDTMLAYGDFNGQDIHVYDTENKTERIVKVAQDGKYIDINRLTLSADGSLLAISGYGLPVQVWDLTTNELRFKLSLVDAVMTFVPDGSLLAISTSQTIRFFNTLTGDLEYSLAGVYGYFIGFSPDGALMLVALAGNNHGAQVLDVKTGVVRRTITYEEGGGYSAFSPDGQFLVTGTAEDRVQVWNIQTGNALQSYVGNGGITFSPDGTLLVTSDPFQIIDLTNGTTHLIEGHYAGQNPVFSADGATLLLGDGISTMVFGVPDANRPEWQPITGHIIPSGVNVRSAPEQSAEVIGYASGDVFISGRNSGGVYLPESGGWVWSDDDYLDLGDHTLADLPPLNTDTQP